MNPNTFDRISGLFAERKLSRRQGLASAQDATPETIPVEPWNGEKTTYLFVQSFHSGSIAPREGEDGRYTVTLEQGTGQTVYFGDRPSRDVGAIDTAGFLDGLGFLEDNPPNAALIIETSPGETDTAVVELYNPRADVDTGTVTYDVAVLDTWRDDLELGLQEDPTDLAALAPEFGTAHLLIDDCPTDMVVGCYVGRSNRFAGSFSRVDSCWNYFVCMPCEPYGHVQPSRCATQEYWNDKCDAAFPTMCEGRCRSDFSWPFANCDYV